MDAAMCDAAVRKVMSHSSELRARTPAGAPTVLTYNKQGYYARTPGAPTVLTYKQGYYARRVFIHS